MVFACTSVENLYETQHILWWLLEFFITQYGLLMERFKALHQFTYSAFVDRHLTTLACEVSLLSELIENDMEFVKQ